MLCDHPLHLSAIVCDKADLTGAEHTVRGETCEEPGTQDTTLVMIHNLTQDNIDNIDIHRENRQLVVEYCGHKLEQRKRNFMWKTKIFSFYTLFCQQLND